MNVNPLAKISTLCSAFLLVMLPIAGCQVGNTEPDAGVEHTTLSSVGAPAPTDTGPSPLAMYPRTEAPAGARVFIVTPLDGAVLTSPVHFEFGATGVSIVPAGVPDPDSGHHHLVINAELPDARFPIPSNESYIHFGDGRTSADLELPPGNYRIRLLLGDHIHIPHLPPVFSDAVDITVVGNQTITLQPKR